MCSAREIYQDYASSKLFSLIIWSRAFLTKILAFSNLNNQNDLPFPSNEWHRGLRRKCEFLSKVDSEKCMNGCPKQTFQAKSYNILLIGSNNSSLSIVNNEETTGI